MGVVNVTPDSFSDGGAHLDPAAAIHHAERLVAEGADLLDIGGESTRPGAAPVPAAEQWARIAPVLGVALGLGVPVSVDTSDPEVMERALALGVDIVNDVRALARPGALEVVARHTAGVCLMHIAGEPATMQRTPLEAPDVVAAVGDGLKARWAAARGHGIADERIVLDPGIGFGKTPAQNLELLRRQGELVRLGRPLLVGWSRKSTLGVITGRVAAADRVAASVAAALLAAQRGAAVLRVHDVAATVDALAVWRAAATESARGG
jgi:dihydropteroate synthase